MYRRQRALQQLSPPEAMHELYAIGHITNDLEPSPHLGGAVAYAAVAVERLGDMAAHVITEAPPQHPYLAELGELGVDAVRLPARDPRREASLTAFRNFYDKNGRRQQIVSNQQDCIDRRDLPHFQAIPPDSIILAAPVMDEVAPAIYPDLAAKGYFVVAPQGYFRQATTGGKVVRRPWDQVEQLKHARLVVLSEEDITFTDRFDAALLEQMRALCSLLVLTRGSEGLTVYPQQAEPIQVAALELKPAEIISPTGAGDACAAAFIWHYLKFADLRAAAAFGAFYAALKLMGIGGSRRGVRALPTHQQVEHFINRNPARFSAFLSSNGLAELRLDSAGHHG